MKDNLLIIAGVALLGLVVWFAFVTMSGRRIAKSIGEPTPEAARIKKESDDIAARVEAQAEKDLSEVENAKGAALYDLARKRLSKD